MPVFPIDCQIPLFSQSDRILNSEWTAVSFGEIWASSLLGCGTCMTNGTNNKTLLFAERLDVDILRIRDPVPSLCLVNLRDPPSRFRFLLTQTMHTPYDIGEFVLGNIFGVLEHSIHISERFRNVV